MKTAPTTRAVTVALLVIVLCTGTGCTGQQSASRQGAGTAAASTPASPGSVPAAGPSHSPDAFASLDPAARRYVDAVASADLDSLVASFAADAVIIDVSREIRGQDAIRRWAAAEVIGGQLTVLHNTPRAGGTTMHVRFAPTGSGGFQARYDFDIADGVITRATLNYA